MTYYHIRYNVYEHSGAAVEKERWITFDSTINDTDLKKHLEQEHRSTVSIILSKPITFEEFKNSKNSTY